MVNLKTEELISALAKWPNRTLFLFALLLIAFVGIIDAVTGPLLSTSIFYVLPIMLVAWLQGRQSGIVMAFIAAFVWLLTDLATGPSLRQLIPYWNAAVRLAFFLIIVWSLTNLKRAQQRQEELIEFVIHDLRSPLASVRTSFELLQDEVADLPSEVPARLVRVGMNSSNTMLILINSLLDLARLESGNMPVQTTRAAVEAMISSAFEQLQLLAERRNVELSTKAISTEPLFVLADFDLTQRVLVNLLSNAIKFSPPKGLVTVETRKEAGGNLIFAINDQGPGIPKKWQGQIFSKFMQTEGRLEGVAVGSGLGLTFCKLAIEAQKGSIWVEPNQEKGTSICFKLPLVETKT